MRIISYNVNGLRAAIKKGLIDWLSLNPADIICLQEIKAGKEDVEVEKLEALGYQTFWFPAQKKGYSGVAIFTKVTPDQVFGGNKNEQSDFEGRILRMDFESVSIINAYYPSGTMGGERQIYKYKWLEEFLEYLIELKAEGRKLIVCGDYNIAHTEIDIHDPVRNKKTSGFLPEERAWMDRLLQNGFVDSFRHLNPEKQGCYSWWSQRFPTVRKNNKGWRLDYICLTDNLLSHLKDAQIFPDVQHSDHCPVYAEIDFNSNNLK